MKLGLCALGLRLALGDARPLLGLGGLALARVSFGPVLAGDLLAPVLELAFTLLDPGSGAHAREHESEKSDDDQRDNDDGDDGAGGHCEPPSMGILKGFPAMPPDE